MVLRKVVVSMVGRGQIRLHRVCILGCGVLSISVRLSQQFAFWGKCFEYEELVHFARDCRRGHLLRLGSVDHVSRALVQSARGDPQNFRDGPQFGRGS